MEEKYYEIEVNGKKIDLTKLSDEELEKLEEYLIEERKMLRKKIDDYIGLKPEDLN